MIFFYLFVIVPTHPNLSCYYVKLFHYIDKLPTFEINGLPMECSLLQWVIIASKFISAQLGSHFRGYCNNPVVRLPDLMTIYFIIDLMINVSGLKLISSRCCSPASMLNNTECCRRGIKNCGY